MDKELLKKLIDEKKTIKDLALIFNKSEGTIRNYISNFNLKAYKFFEPDQYKDQIIDMYLNQLKDGNEIAQSFNLSKDQVWKALRRWRIQPIMIGSRRKISITDDLMDRILELVRKNYSLDSISAETKLTRDVIKERLADIGITATGYRNKRSQYEREIVEFLYSLGVKVELNNRKILRPKELDIYLPEYNLAIEYCGLYWHSELNGKSRSYHKEKLTQCNLQGIRLLTIFEDEWKYKSDIVKSRLTHFLGKTLTKIGARECRLEQISSALAGEFCDKNHIQGRGRSKISYGLFYNSELISVMCFENINASKSRSKSDLGNKQIFELSRFCSKLNTVIHGGAKKLLQHFINNHSFQEIRSYADLRWSEGNVYKNLGFNLSHISPPSYEYFKPGNYERFHKANYRKNKLGLGRDITEWEYCKNILGLDRIWDCGKQCWSLSNLTCKWESDNLSKGNRSEG